MSPICKIAALGPLSQFLPPSLEYFGFFFAFLDLLQSILASQNAGPNGRYFGIGFQALCLQCFRLQTLKLFRMSRKKARKEFSGHLFNHAIQVPQTLPANLCKFSRIGMEDYNSVKFANIFSYCSDRYGHGFTVQRFFYGESGLGTPPWQT